MLRSSYWAPLFRSSPWIKVSNIEHLPGAERLHDSPVKTKNLTAKQILAVPCATCGAAVGEVCELNNGEPRTEPHRDRKLSAAEVLEE
jgi:hypothetical protein